MTVGAIALQAVPSGMATAVTRIAGLALVAGSVGVLVAALYRWYAREIVSNGLPVLAGLAAVAVYLNTTAALGQVINDGPGQLDPAVALLNTVTFVLAGLAALAGRQVGDRFARALGAVTRGRDVESDLSRLVRSVGRSIAVTMPETPAEIEDVVGYDPVPAETKEALAGRTLVFPRGLSVGELRDRLTERLRDDYGVGHVDVDLADDGTVEYVALGSRAAGIGPTLPPGTAATAVRADPPYAASAGDLVQVWTDGESPEQVTSGEVRGTAGDVVTLATDEADAEDLDPLLTYRLVTLPSEPRADREFAALLRRADETMGTATVEEGSSLVGTAVADLDVTVAAIRHAGGGVRAIPPREQVIEAGDTIYAVGRPGALRGLERSTSPA